MAEFSRQYCETFDSEFPWDFDILEEFAHLEPDSMVNTICEGFGFVAIGKSAEGEMLLAEVVTDQPQDLDPNHHLIQWRTLDEFIEKTKQQHGDN
jgi:hypothetical protein